MYKSSLTELISANLDEWEINSSLILSKISVEITKYRINHNMSQKEFAKFMGVSQSMISKWENGDYNFTIDTLCKIYSKMNMDFDISVQTIAHDEAKTAVVGLEYTPVPFHCNVRAFQNVSSLQNSYIPEVAR